MNIKILVSAVKDLEEGRMFYEKGRKVTDKELENVYIEKSNFHGEWNYKIKPES